MKSFSFLPILFSLLLFLSATGCDSGGGGGGIPAQTLVVVGDSITAGGTYAGVPPWPSLLQSNQPQVGVVNRSVGGQRMEEGVARLPSLIAQHQPRSVVIFLGSNNAIQSNTAFFESSLRGAIQNARAAEVPNVLVCTLPPMFDARSIYNGTVAALNETIRIVAGQEGARVIYVDREFDAVTSEPQFPDGLHPNLEGQSIIAATVADYL